MKATSGVGESARWRDDRPRTNRRQINAPHSQLAKSVLIESAATVVVSIGRALFKHGEPSDPESQRRYRFYKALEAALALPAGPERLEALYKAYRELRAN